MSDPTPERRARGVLDTLVLRQRLTTEQAAARSLLVRRLRIVLPVVALALVGLFFLNTRSDTVDQAFLEDFKSFEATTEELKTANARVTGIDDEGQPYEITADEALQNPGEQEIVHLVRPRAVSRNEGEETVATAARGAFHSANKILNLEDGVRVEHSVGAEAYIFTTPKATVSYADETVESDAGVEGVSESGTLRADRMRAYNKEGRVVFEGNVSMRIYPKGTKALKGAGGEKKEGEDESPT